MAGGPVPARAPAACRVRPASADDVAALAALYRQEVEFHQRLARYYRVEPEFDWNAFVRARLEGDDRTVLVAEADGVPVGFVHLRVTGYAPPRGLGYRLRRLVRGRTWFPALPIQPLSWGVIEDCFVVDACRRQGVGEALASGAMEWFASRGVRRVELAVLHDNPGARGFWEAVGFAPFRVSMWRALGDGAPGN
jgi:ribosomal protein S18 acetylase RimI-like enzyme